MRSYQVCVDQYYFREIGQKMPIGSIIDLRQGDAERYQVSHPGLLKPLPMTTQVRPEAIRSAPAESPADEEKASEPVAPAEEVKGDESVVADEGKPEPAADADQADVKPTRKPRAKK